MDEAITDYIDRALRDRTLRIKYQPQFCRDNDRYVLSGAEALLRPDRGVCSLERLIHVAERTGKIVDIGMYVMETALMALAEWTRSELVNQTFSMSVNITGSQIADSHFSKNVMTLVEKYDVNPYQLTLEITESSILRDTNVAHMYTLSREGVSISLDDFGTGYSSLGRLKLLPIREIKIDKEFVTDITKTEQDIAIITALYQLTYALNKFTVVEGVETQQQFNLLEEIGFKCYQGYFFCQPLSREDFEDLAKLIDSLHCS